MKKYPLVIFAIICLCACNNNPVKEVAKQVTDEIESLAPEKVLRHVVMFKFKDDATAEDVKKVEDAFSALPAQIPEIRDYEWGLNNSPENLNKGLTHCFLVTFHSEEDREIYLPHPAHKEFVEILGPHLDDVCVLDFWSK